MTHELARNIDNSLDKLLRESIAFLKMRCGESRNDEMLNWKDEMTSREHYNSHRIGWQQKISNAQAERWQEVWKCQQLQTQASSAKYARSIV